MSKKILAGAGMIIFAVGLAGCQRSPTPAPTPAASPTPQPTVTVFTEADAKVIAEKTCIKGGETLAAGYYNEATKTWWFDANLNSTQKGCNAACVVSAETKTAEINWRCTGLNDDGTETGVVRCADEQRNVDVCTKEYRPVCATVEIQCIRAPCYPIQQTFSNPCEACRNPLVPSYVSGTCQESTEIVCPPECPAYPPLASGACPDGVIVPGPKNECGCATPPVCSSAYNPVKQLFITKYPKYAKTLSITIENEINDFARGSVSFERGAPGGIFLAAKADGAWVIVHDGNGEIPCSFPGYRFPNVMLSDCSRTE